MLIFCDFVQVDKCDAQLLSSCIYTKKIALSLHRQTETETGSAGKQPVRDKFDLHEIVIRIVCFDSPFLLHNYYHCLGSIMP
jgi:hypothetical protein